MTRGQARLEVGVALDREPPPRFSARAIEREEARATSERAALHGAAHSEARIRGETVAYEDRGLDYLPTGRGFYLRRAVWP